MNAAAIVRAHRAVGLVQRRHRIPKQRYPKLIEMEYGNAIVAMVGRARSAYAPLIAELPRLLALTERRRDELGGESDSQRARRLIAMATTRLEQSIHPTEIEQLATQFAGRTQRFQKQQLQRQIRAAFGVDVPASDARIPTMIEHFVGQNVALIKAIPTEMSMRLDKSVTAAFTTGQRHEDLAREIESRFDIGERHARLIARDQIGKLAGQVNAARQQSIGITHFVWRTVGDERVREERGFRRATQSHSRYHALLILEG